WNQARHDWWHLDSGESRFAGGCEPLGLSPLSRLEHHTQVETQVRYIWKRMAWIDGLRGEHRKDVFKKVAIEGSPLAVRQRAIRSVDNGLASELGDNLLVQTLNLLIHHW